MGITRRQFLRWSGVSTLGAVMFNGCRIPEEELQIESPVDMPEDLVSGIDNWYATVCQHDMSSGIIVRVVEGRAKKIEGNPDYPMNQGRHSARSEAALQSLYHPDRLVEPLYRDQRLGQLVPISWASARQILSDKLAGLSDKGKFRIVTGPLRGHLALLTSEFVKGYGGAHMAFESLEQVTLKAAIKSVFGQNRLPEFDIANAKHLVAFGADFLSTWQAPVRYARAYGEFRQGESRRRGTHVQVDSRFSMTAASADEWVPVKPGGEGVLALSMAYVMIRDGYVPSVHAQALTDGKLLPALDNFSPENESVRNATGVDASRIETLAHEFANPGNQPALAIGGGSAGAHTSGLFNLKAIYALNVLVNNINSKGGVILNPDPPIKELSGQDVVSMGTPASLEEWQSLSGQNVEVLMTRGVNPIHGLPKAAGFSEVMANASFVVSFASFLDETVALADLVLPEHTYLEDWGDDVPDPGPGYQVFGIQQPVVRPFHEGTRSFGDELLILGASVANDLTGILGLEPGDEQIRPEFRDLLRKGAYDLWMQNRGSVKAETFDGFWNGILERGGWWDMEKNVKSQSAPDPLPIGSDGKITWPTIEFQGQQGVDTFNLLPFLSNSMMDGTLAHLPWLQATPDPITSMTWHSWVEINSKTAKDMGIKEGDMLELSSPSGIVEAPAYLHPAVPPWTVSVPVGQGHTDYGQYASGVGVNIMNIIAPMVDADTRALAWAGTRVKVRNTGVNIDIPKFEGSVPSIEAEEGQIIQITNLH